MSGKRHEPLSDTALELIMRDVLSGLEDLSNLTELAWDGEVDILPAAPEPVPPTGDAARNRPARLRRLQ